MLSGGDPTPLVSSSPSVRSKSNGHLIPPSLSFSRSPHPLPTAYTHLRCNPPPLLSKSKPSQMSSNFSASNVTELNDVSDFDVLSSPEGCISICGFGSLLSEKSARCTFPDLKNFRVGVLRGFQRVFAHVAPIFFERGIANQETGEVSSLSVEPCDEEFLIVTVFEIKKEEVPSFIERENEFRFLAVVPESLEGMHYGAPAVVCARYSDDEYFQIRCKATKNAYESILTMLSKPGCGEFGLRLRNLCIRVSHAYRGMLHVFLISRRGSAEIFFQCYGRYNIHKIWRDDILPCRVYLRHCVLAAKNLGQASYDNFLDHTFLADRKTTIRQYLATTGFGIMEEEPPEALKSRYGG